MIFWEYIITDLKKDDLKNEKDIKNKDNLKNEDERVHTMSLIR